MSDEPGAPACHVEVTDEQNCLTVDSAFVREVITDVLKTEGVYSADVSIALVDNATIRRLHREFMNDDTDTDVLSFPLDAGEPPRERPPPDPTGAQRRGYGRNPNGEVVVSVEKATQVAAEFGWRPLDEVILYAVHGVLHLVGYDDLTSDEKRLMRSRERSLLDRWDLQPQYRDPDLDGKGDEPASEQEQLEC